ncbi:hypothetical protein AAG570_011772 [Ranatra chinensis]|uniref:Protein yellow n=1 Tax=Ranatra chinensis TaxID=642074 RepID=A0ABD0YGW2_9HEMI
MYQPANIIPTRMQMYKEYAFIVTPRFRHGVPFTLGRIDMNDESPFNPCLEPFPSWKANYETNQEALQNVVDLYLDVEDSLWVLDIGVMFTYQRPTIVQGPRIFNLCPETGKVRLKILIWRRKFLIISSSGRYVGVVRDRLIILKLFNLAAFEHIFILFKAKFFG